MEYTVQAIAKADFADWITVAAYGAAAVVCILAWRRASRGETRQGSAIDARFWAVSAIALIALGINELLDLQTLLTAIGKAHAQANGWYEDRRPVQYAFIVGLAVASLIAVAAMFYWGRKTSAAIRFALAGFILIGVFIVFRAASFHHLDQWLGSGFQAFNLGSVQEVAGIVIIAAAALFYSPSGANSHRIKPEEPE
jgi:amino acid transporter